jgi:Acetyltransferases, including N-acetylases of ribosomal proteins
MEKERKRLLIPLFETLQGKKVILRSYKESDAEAFLEAMIESRERLLLWLPWPAKCQTLDDARSWLIQDMASWLLREQLHMGIWDIETQHFLGGISLRPHSWEIPFFEIGYWLRTSAERKGYMTEAVHLLTTFAFEKLGAKRVMIRIDERNQHSIAVAERLHFKREGTLRNYEMAPDGRLQNIVIFALTSEDWEKSPNFYGI